MEWVSSIYNQLNMASLAAGAILGTVCGMLIPRIAVSLSSAIMSFKRNQRKKFLESGKVHKWLLDYYRGRGALNDLYVCVIGGSESRIPFFTKRDWQGTTLIAPHSDDIVVHKQASPYVAKVNMRMLKKRHNLGQRIFGGGDTLCLDRITDHGSLQLHVRRCRFYQMATALVSLEEETFRTARWGRLFHTPIRDESLSSLEVAGKVNTLPYSTGCTVALAFREENSYELALHTRSHSTMTFGGTKAVIPNFGLEPNSSERGKSEYSILFHNFLREYCEELFDYEQLIDTQKERRPSPDWFTQLPEASKILELQSDGKFELYFLGFGIDALNGTGNIALLAIIEDIDTIKSIRMSMKANWEVGAGSSTSESIEFIDIYDERLETWLKNHRIQYGSAFTLALAIKQLEALMENRKLKGTDDQV
ncbi:MAG: hypothetical protein OEV49_01705 [candidate division Zixibacteria bacterium]|nr:hypothetical protein [candidate division Zixibacteria bacterium]MDH3938089.1 hypothetical protein [candidate division Zixibacteria bacterium]MDH4034931.1 hypothetical protein [candidate division Zixibacteria bacterium]